MTTKFNIGDIVRVEDDMSPKYLAGARGEIVRFAEGFAVVMPDAEHCSFQQMQHACRGEIYLAESCLEK